MNRLLLCIISSEKTWKNLSKFKFDIELKRLRNEFDLAVVLNGYAFEAVDYYANFKPEYFFLRPNLGFDSAAIAHFIELAPEYYGYLIMHDDHWFEQGDWFEYINELLSKDNNADIWGNILYERTRPLFSEYCSKLEVSHLASYNLEFYLHGMSGLFSNNAIKLLKEHKIPYVMDMDKENANKGERLFSTIIKHQGLKIDSFPEGPYVFFKHNDGNHKNHLFSTANKHFYYKDFVKAKEYYYKYYEYCKENNFFDHMPILFNNLARTHYEIKEIEVAKVFWKNLLDQIPHFPVDDGVREFIQDQNYN